MSFYESEENQIELTKYLKFSLYIETSMIKSRFPILLVFHKYS